MSNEAYLTNFLFNAYHNVLTLRDTGKDIIGMFWRHFKKQKNPRNIKIINKKHKHAKT